MRKPLAIALLLSTSLASAGLLQNGNFDTPAPPPAGISPWQALGSGVVVALDTSAPFSPPYALRVSGRSSATDGVVQGAGLAANLVNGAGYVSTFRIKLDAPAQVRCLLSLTGSQAQSPILLAEKVVRAGDVGTWVEVRGSNRVAWTGSVSTARVYFAVEQFFPASAPAGAYPSFALDDVSLEADGDLDGWSDAEETVRGTSPAAADTDGDGMPDRWESVHGLDPSLASAADLDTDADGAPDRLEYWANTSPSDAASYPGLCSDPEATPAARALLYDLQTRAGRATGRRLSGQHAQDTALGDDFGTYVAGLHDLLTAAGHPSWVSVLGLGAEGPSASSPLQIATSAPLGRAYIDAGGLVMLHWTPRNPWTNGFNGDHTGVDIDDLLDPGSAAHARMVGWMDAIADELALFGPERPVMFRPLSEMNGPWNWYGKLRQDDFVRLYRWVRDHFVGVRGLHNILWTVESHVGVARPAGLANAGVSLDYYWPGDDAADIIGFSTYISGWNPGFDTDAASRQHPKAFAITEGGPPANEDDAINGYNGLYLDRIDQFFPRAAFFVIWNSFPGAAHMAIRDNPGYVELLTDPRVANRETLLWRAPSPPSAAASSTSTLSTTWDPVVGSTGYVLETSTTGSAPWLRMPETALAAVSIDGLTAGASCWLRLRARYGAWDSGPSAPVEARTWTEFQGWRASWFSDPNADPEADIDGDGLSSALEFAFGAEPLVASPRRFPRAERIDVSGSAYAALRFSRRAGVPLVVEATSDLQTGPWLAGPSQEGVAVDLGDGSEEVLFRDDQPLSSGGQRFLRVRFDGP